MNWPTENHFFFFFYCNFCTHFPGLLNISFDYIAQFTSDVYYIKGPNNVVANTLSRSTIQTIQTQPLNFDMLAEEQQCDTMLDSLKKIHHFSLENTLFNSAWLQSTSTGYSWPYVPPTMCKKFLHSGYKTSLKLISDHFVWFNMSSDIKYWKQTCLKCHCSKIQRHTKFTYWTVSRARWTVYSFICWQWGHYWKWMATITYLPSLTNLSIGQSSFLYKTLMQKPLWKAFWKNVYQFSDIHQ